MQTSIIYREILRDCRFGIRRMRCQGGQYSGKTVNILAAAATLASEDNVKSSTSPPVTTVTSISMPHLKGGALRDFEMFVYPEFRSAIRKYHRTDHIFSFKSGHDIEFKVFENEETARGPKRKRLFVNEANKMPWMIFKHLDGRSEQTVYDYNPSVNFWAHEHHTGDGETKLYVSDHRHNPFLTEEKHREIENFCTFARDEFGNVIFDKGKPVITRGSYELWLVYARGLSGNVTGVIFPDWEIIEDEDFPAHNDTRVAEWIYSIDFGYTNDPTAIIKMCKIANTIYLKEIGYETGMQPAMILENLQNNGYEWEMPLYCEHDPDMIRILRNLGIQALFARKGQGSIKAGIELFHTFKVKYPYSSRNITDERKRYVWEEDKFTGKPTNSPVDMFNHAMDASRYGVYSKFLRSDLR